MATIDTKTQALQQVPYLDLSYQYKAMKDSIQTRINTVLEHGQFILGPEVAQSEKALAEFAGAKYCLTAASGTDALLLALMAVGVQPGDEVITTPFTFFATAEVISLLGAVPVFADIEEDTFNLSPESAAKAITSKTRAIMPVSLYGQPADFKEFESLGAAKGIAVIEDAAQSFGARLQSKPGKRSGAFGAIGATSFFPAKPLGCYGDGGAVFTDDPELFKKMGVLRVHGQESRYHHTQIGINGRLDTLQCAVLIEKLKRYDWEIERRQRIASLYNQAFADLGEKVSIPKVKSDRDSVWAQYTVLVENRDRFASVLKERGVPTSVHYPSPLHWQPVYKELRDKFKLPIAEKVSQKCISLPLYADMPDEHVERVIEGVRMSVRQI